MTSTTERPEELKDVAILGKDDFFVSPIFKDETHAIISIKPMPIDKAKNTARAILYLIEDAGLAHQKLDWEDINQRYCPTHEISFHMYCKLCKDEIKSLRKLVKALSTKGDKR